MKSIEEALNNINNDLMPTACLLLHTYSKNKIIMLSDFNLVDYLGLFKNLILLSLIFKLKKLVKIKKLNYFRLKTFLTESKIVAHLISGKNPVSSKRKNVV